MSAFILDNAHIRAMLQAAAPKYSGDGAAYQWYDSESERWIVQPFGGHQQEIGQKLVDENYRSFNYRYGEDTEPHEYKQAPTMKVYSQVELIKLCNCYMYQSCETPDWEASEAHAIVTALQERAISNLDGYDEAAWVIYDERG